MDDTTPNISGTSTMGTGTSTGGMGSTTEKYTQPVHSTVDKMSSAAHQTVDQLASGVSNVADRFSDQTRWATEAPGKALEYSRSWVQEKPMQAVGTALALGFILGRLTGR